MNSNETGAVIFVKKLAKEEAEERKEKENS